MLPKRVFDLSSFDPLPESHSRYRTWCPPCYNNFYAGEYEFPSKTHTWPTGVKFIGQNSCAGAVLVLWAPRCPFILEQCTDIYQDHFSHPKRGIMTLEMWDFQTLGTKAPTTHCCDQGWDAEKISGRHYISCHRNKKRSKQTTHLILEKAVAPHSSTPAWKIPWMEEPGGLQSMGSQGVGHDWATSLSLFTFLHWRRK